MRQSVAFLFSIVFVILAGCKSSDLSASVVQDSMIYTLTIPKNAFDSQDTLTGKFEVLNFSQQSRRFDFPNQNQFGFLLQGSSPDPVLEYPYIFLPAISEFTLSGGEKKTFSISSPFENSSGQQIPPGEYTVQAFLLTFDGSAPRVSLMINVR